MSLNKTDLANVMKLATQGAIDPTIALLALGNSIAGYIIANTSIEFVWEAVNSQPPNDPEIKYPSGNILTCVILLTPSLATTINLNSNKASGGGLSLMSTQITAGVKLGTLNITDSGYSTSPVTMSDFLGFDFLLDITSDRNSAYEQIAEQIINAITSYSPSTPVTGTRGTYVGATTSATIN